MPPEKHGDVMKPDHEFKEEVKTIVAESVRQTLMQLGIASNDPIEMQKDMQHLREWQPLGTPRFYGIGSLGCRVGQKAM